MGGAAGDLGDARQPCTEQQEDARGQRGEEWRLLAALPTHAATVSVSHNLQNNQVG